MAPRHLPDRPDDDRPSELQPSARKNPDDVTPVNEHPVPETKRNVPHNVKSEEVEIEDDRIEAYLRGPTAFTA